MMKTLARPDDKAEILRRLGTLRAESARRWGRMNAHQMVCHVADALRMASGTTEVRSRANLAWRTIGKWVVLYLPMRWPAGIPTCPEIDQELGGTRPEAFGADVGRIEALLEAVTSPAAGLARTPHPLFGAMSEEEWLRWGYLHMDHHLRQFGA